MAEAWRVRTGHGRTPERATIARLEARIEILERDLAERDETIAALAGAPGAAERLRTALGLASLPAALLAVLALRPLSRAGAMALLWAEPPETAERALDVHVWRIRGALARHGMTIETVRAWGWDLPAETRARLRTMIAGEQS